MIIKKEKKRKSESDKINRESRKIKTPNFNLHEKKTFPYKRKKTILPSLVKIFHNENIEYTSSSLEKKVEVYNHHN